MFTSALMHAARGMAKPLIIMTDLEPDDMLALKLLAARGYGCPLLLVGEGDPEVKRRRANAYAPMLNWPARAWAGAPSSKLFPGEVDAPPAQRALTAALEGVPTPPTEEELLAALEAYGLAVPDAKLLCLKPPRELQALWESAQESTREGIPKARLLAAFARLTLVMYGSFNLRTLGYERTLWMVAPETPFRRVVLYESMGGTAEGVKNINQQTVPIGALWADRGGSTSGGVYADYDACLRAACSLWDEDIIRDCRETCAATEAGRAAGDAEAVASWDRNYACLVAVEANKGNQFVAADPVLAVLMDDHAFDAYLKPVDITFDKAKTLYPAVAPATATDPRVFKYVGVPWEAVVEAMRVLERV
jgi:hypothetical protein